MKTSSFNHFHTNNSKDIVIAVPKGRLATHIFSYFEKKAGITLSYKKRSLMVENKTHNIKILLVKNVDLPEYIQAGIAHIGIVGSDVLYEHSSLTQLLFLGTFPFGKTKICLITTKGQPAIDSLEHTKVASKYIRYTQDFLHKKGIQAQVIPLQGSVELAPLLKLTPYIVDLVETGETIKENNLVIAEEIEHTQVQCIANKALYKLNYLEINTLIRKLKI